jgi:iron complex outermembrane receptor protein
MNAPRHRLPVARIRHRAGAVLSGCLVASALLAAVASAQQVTEGGKAPSSDGTAAAADEEAAGGSDAAAPRSEGEAREADAAAELAPSRPEPLPAPRIEEIEVVGRRMQIVVPDPTVSAVGFDPAELKAEGISDIRDLSNFTPSLDIKSAFAATNPTIFIRGVGLDDYNANAAGAVAIYQDGVYMASPAGQLFQFFDAEEVGVLRGPQPTLFRNASAGAILVRSAEPTDEFEAYLSSTYGRFNQVDVEGAVGGPIVPGWLSGRLSGTWGIRDGITKNRCGASPNNPDCQPFPGKTRILAPGLGDYTNDIDAFAARGQLLFQLPVGETETRWLLNAHGGKNWSRAFQFQHGGAKFFSPNEACPNYPAGQDPANDPACLFIPNLTSPNANQDSLQYEDGDDDPFAGDYDIDGAEDLSLWGTNLKGTWSFGDGYELTSLTAYEWHDRFTQENTDASPNLMLHTDYGDTAWQVSQQLELTGNWSESEVGDGSWLLGSYYLQEDLQVDNFFDAPPQGFGQDLEQHYTQKTRYFAPYARSEYNLDLACELVPCDFTLISGVRYNWEFKEFDTDVCSFSANNCIFFELRKDQDDEAWSGLGGEVSVAWNFREDANVYLKYTHGWKGGHFNGGATSEFDVVTGVDPETIDSYEVGLRSYWFDGRLMLNATGFYYDYSDLQVFIVEQTPAGFPIPKLVNAADTLVYGVELDLGAEPLPGLEFTYNFSWVKSEYKDFVVSLPFFFRQERVGPGGRPTNIVRFDFDYSGNPLIAAPLYAMTGSAAYEIPLPWQVGSFGLGSLTPRFSFSWKDEVFYDAASGQGAQVKFPEGTFGQEAYWVLNASLRWRSEDGRFELLGWVHNFLDEHYKTQSFDLTRELELVLDAYADPRTYGITATITF